MKVLFFYLLRHIDHSLIIPYVVKTSYQILNNATLIAYSPFDTNAPMLDRSVNSFPDASAVAYSKIRKFSTEF
jgi:hypothetical protein